MKKDPLMDFISWCVIAFAVITILSMGISNWAGASDPPKLEYPVSKEVNGQTLYFKDEATMIRYFTE